VILRPRQRLFVERSLTALSEHGNSLGVAPTGAGKTIMLSAVVGRQITEGAKACVLAHRDELTDQNSAKFSRVVPWTTTSVVDARGKDWSGQCTFAMVPTLARPRNLDQMPTLDLLVIDEAHHAVASTYRRVIDRALDLNPECAIYGVTATANRGDKKGLRPVFSNVADQITIGELVRSGHLVPPKTFAIDVGVEQALSELHEEGEGEDMDRQAAILDRTPVTDAVIEHWREKAGDRRSVAFCATLDHARNVTTAFIDAGVNAEMVWGDMPAGDRRETLARYAAGECQVLVNVGVLTEGWDDQLTSCVVLLRLSSYKSTMTQMIGRGLRCVDPTLHPGVVKTDCLVLDFGMSARLHGCLEQEVDLEGREADGEAPTKTCPECDAIVPIAVRECPICGYVFIEDDGDLDQAPPIRKFVMSEIDLLKASSFEWCDLFNDDCALMAAGFEGWAGVFFLDGRWHAVGGSKFEETRLLAVGERVICIAAGDDWLNTHETESAAHKTRSWLRQPATDRQRAYLPAALRDDPSISRYHASAMMTFRFNKPAILRLVEAAGRQAA
jgi:superfamily II DNA or RNA helicase